jgi:L-alanine-DL-glutamate epimerase-like enolase superfamily enzyme
MGKSTGVKMQNPSLAEEQSAIELIRSIIGPSGKIRIDCNEAWTLSEAVRNLEVLDRWDLDFVEQPVAAEPIDNMLELKMRTPVPLSANESANGWANAWAVIKKRASAVLCFSEYFVGSIGEFHRLGHAAAAEGLSVCLGTHGELGIAAAAHQHVLLNLPRVVEGNQKVANLMLDDIIKEQLPIATKPSWGVIEGAGLGIEVDEQQLEKYHQSYLNHGQYLPYDLQKVLAARL